MLSQASKLPNKDNYVVSRYIENPHLINGFKYDLRLYVLATGYNPLRLYRYEEGLVRFATELYCTDPESLTDKCVHLTNFSINKFSEKFVKNEGAENSETSSKWSLSGLKQYFECNGLDYEQVLRSINDVIIKTIITIESSVYSALVYANSNSNCYQLYGFDVLIDNELKPWLLEVNLLPSLSSSSLLDKEIKTALVCDTMTLVGFRLAQNPPVSSRIRRKALLNDELSEEERELLMDIEDEFNRTGNYSRIFPVVQKLPEYSLCFEVRRYSNELLWKHMKSNFRALNPHRKPHSN